MGLASRSAVALLVVACVVGCGSRAGIPLDQPDLTLPPDLRMDQAVPPDLAEPDDLVVLRDLIVPDDLAKVPPMTVPVAVGQNGSVPSLPT